MISVVNVFISWCLCWVFKFDSWSSKARGFKWFLWAVQTLFHVSSSQDQRETCITKTCPCNKQTDFFSLKNENLQQKKNRYFSYF